MPPPAAIGARRVIFDFLQRRSNAFIHPAPRMHAVRRPVLPGKKAHPGPVAARDFRGN
jgi:hypothetical protein